MTGLWILFCFKFVSEIVIFFPAFNMSISMSECCLSVTLSQGQGPKCCEIYQKSAHDRWASSDQGHCDHELFFRITFICTDVTAKCIYNIGTGFYIVGMHWHRQNPLFGISVERFYWNMRIIDWEWDLFLAFNISISFDLTRRVY